MKSPLLALAILLPFVSVTRADIYMPVGESTGVTAKFTFSVDTRLNQVSVEVDNRYAGVGGVTGTITSFGFDVPTALAPSGTLISQSWDILTPLRLEPADWVVYQPYDINVGGGDFWQSFGVITGDSPNGGDPQAGILFGEVVSFVFQFDDFGPGTILGPDGVTARWQSVGENGEFSDVGRTGDRTPSGDFTPIPESSTFGMVGAAGLMMLTLLRRRRGQRVQVLG